MLDRKQRGPEKNARDRGRAMRLDKEIHNIMGSEAFIDVLEEARADKEALAKFKVNPKAHLKGKGIAISDEVEVEFAEEASWHCCFYYYYW